MMNRRTFVSLLGAAPLAAQTPEIPADLEWHDVRKFTVEGLGFKDLKSPFDRLPARAENVVRKEVWNLSRDSSGVAVRFIANSKALYARWTVGNKTLAGANITAIAASGLDLYAKDDAGKFRWLGVGKPTKFPDNTDMLVTGVPAGAREYMLYLPLRNAVTSLEIGLPKGASIEAAPKRPASRKAIVFYGTSITHGISASRPGMTHPAILGRVFDREIVNLGFSGNGRMELEVAKFLVELDPAVFVLDCLPNMSAKDINERAEACVKLIREARPSTPILLVEDRFYTNTWLLAARRKHNEDNHEAMRAVYAKLQRDKVPHLFYLKGDNLLGDDNEGAVDSSHPTDLGFMRQAAEFQKVLAPILK